ncbi:UDP-N-acetylmuramoyl-L-alanyl-D-glutamate--2,6-diaminopimelate ligase [Candidatus Avelusimicrobium sp.]|uniref:UDP-N-acetylmuramoyl-L-alanyl-D-glutamate--2, 6-diaminopimelate ligase n=1 Tax=Candidatus Avelusimicrobium sp. TaxID=3048833 RepID=UPI003D7D99A8
MSSIVLNKARRLGLHITGLTFHSQEVRPGSIFFALKGANADGNLYIGDAVQRGAVLVVSAQPRPSVCAVPYLQSTDIDRDMADAAYEFYGRPSDAMQMIGITGTKGKTSIAYLLESILTCAGRKVGVLGTVNYRMGGKVLCAAPNTTPAAIPLFNLLAQMKKAQCQNVVMEVSSHALDQQRVKHIWYNTAVFTNLQRDHLDYHHTFENYFLAKQKLFENLADPANSKSNRTAVINADDPYGVRLADRLKGRVKVVTFGLEKEADFKATNICESLTGTSFCVNGMPMQISLLGRHNVYNALAAYAAAKANGVDEAHIKQGLLALPGVPGRMERIDEGQDFFVFVDFAYTDESLNRALDTVAPFKKGRTIVVFGCGGQRDRTKRPLMGHTACTRADYVFLTNDNPRCEDPKQIFNDILQGMNGQTNYELVPDRAEAIRSALSSARKNDIVIIAGKGHEDYQIIGTEKKHFSDQETVRAFLHGRKTNV